MRMHRTSRYLQIFFVTTLNFIVHLLSAYSQCCKLPLFYEKILSVSEGLSPHHKHDNRVDLIFTS